MRAPRTATADSRRIALLRGINVGRAKRVAMADLRGLVEDLGFTRVRTLLASGNVVFAAPGVAPSEAAAAIREALAARLGLAVRVTVVTAAELDTAAEENPLALKDRDPSRLLVAFPADSTVLSRLATLAEEEWAPEALAVGSRAAYLWCPDGILGGRLAKAVDRAVGDAVTSRNVATVRKLRDLARRDG